MRNARLAVSLATLSAIREESRATRPGAFARQIARDLAFGIRLLAAPLVSPSSARSSSRSASGARPPSSASCTVSCCARSPIATRPAGRTLDAIASLRSAHTSQRRRLPGVAAQQHRVRGHRARECAAEFQPDRSGRTGTAGRRPIVVEPALGPGREPGTRPRLYAGRAADWQRTRRLAR